MTLHNTPSHDDTPLLCVTCLILRRPISAIILRAALCRLIGPLERPVSPSHPLDTVAPACAVIPPVWLLYGVIQLPIGMRVLPGVPISNCLRGAGEGGGGS